MILRSGRLMVFKQAYNVVVLPEPVGPVTRYRSSGALMSLFRSVCWSLKNLRSSKPRTTLDLSDDRRVRLCFGARFRDGQAAQRLAGGPEVDLALGDFLQHVLDRVVGAAVVACQ